MLELVVEIFALKMWHTESIDVLRYPDIFSQDWDILQDVVVRRMQDSLHSLASNVLHLFCTIIPIYIADGVMIIILPHLWNGRA